MAERYFKQPSVMSSQKHFSQVPSAEIQRSTFDRSHGHKTTFDAGLLIPIFCDEVLPGDTFNVDTTAFCRLATPLKPVMDNIYLDIHYFFVPNRLVWDHWENFCGQRDRPDDDPADYSMPLASVNPSDTSGTLLSQYFGIPMRPGAPLLQVNALPFRAYFLIWNEWYRDQNLQEPIIFSKDETVEDLQYFTPSRRGKRHDYFTSCLPWPQKGDPVTIPLGVTAPVIPSGTNPSIVMTGTSTIRGMYVEVDADVNVQGGNPATAGGFRWEDTGMLADLAAATAITINDLRTAFQIQRLLERDARGGTRYIELVLSHFGVRSDDARLQRPEYLGGGTQMVNINPVASTAAVTDVPQGNLAAVGTGLGKGGFTKSFTEHGFVIGLMSARCDLTYQQGLDRMWSRRTRYDHYWPALAHLGEQGVKNKELYFSGSAVDDQIFGYQERYAEYRYKLSKITGKFNSEATGSLDVWHLAQDFTSLPPFNENFIEEWPPIGRISAVQTEPHFLADIWFKYTASRPMPVYSVPGLIDHF